MSSIIVPIQIITHEYLTFCIPEVLQRIFGYVVAAHNTTTIDDDDEHPLANLAATCSILHAEVDEFIDLEEYREAREAEAKLEKARKTADEVAEVYYGYRMKFHFMTSYGSQGWESRGEKSTMPLTNTTGRTGEGRLQHAKAKAHKARSLSIDSGAANKGERVKTAEKKAEKKGSVVPVVVTEERLTPTGRKPAPLPEQGVEALMAELFALASPISTTPMAVGACA